MLLVIDSNRYSFDYAKRWEDGIVRRSGNSLAMAITFLFGHGLVDIILKDLN